jgi:hypothetical protein
MMKVVPVVVSAMYEVPAEEFTVALTSIRTGPVIVDGRTNVMFGSTTLFTPLYEVWLMDVISDDPLVNSSGTIRVMVCPVMFALLTSDFPDTLIAFI